MLSAIRQLVPDRRREPLGRRAIAFLIALGIHVLLIVLLLTLAPPTPKAKDEPKVFELRSFNEPKAVQKPAARAKKAPSKPAPRAPVTPPVVPKVTPAPQLFVKQLFEGVDISKLPNHRDEIAAADESTGTGQDSKADYGPGEGPGGQTLYRAEWFKEPTHAELAYYLPRGAPAGSWAVIACRTVERYRVEDCQALGESPTGSGLSRAIVNAAWQFRVKPPRINGKFEVGAWVKIRIDFSQPPAETGTP